MQTYHCKKCNRQWEAPADLLGVPKCKQCRGYGTEGALPSADKQYLLFAGDHYYPSGGVNDLQGSFNSLDEAIAEVKRQRPYSDGSGSDAWENTDHHWWQIVDRATMKIALSSDC